VFRYDLVWEFVSAIVEGRAAVPSFYDGLQAQIVAAAVLQSEQAGEWISIEEEPR
jgi:predicted dehydrogenase